jgi:hypothetical protein
VGKLTRLAIWLGFITLAVSLLDAWWWIPGHRFNPHVWLSSDLVPKVTDAQRAEYQRCLQDLKTVRAPLFACHNPEIIFRPMIFTRTDPATHETREICLDYCLKHGEWRVLYDKSTVELTAGAPR